MKIVYLSSESSIGRRCAAATSSRLISAPFPGGMATSAVEVKQHLAVWGGFLDSYQAHTRYNSPWRFTEGAAQVQPDQPPPLAILFYTDRLRAVVIGDLRSRDRWHGFGPLGFKLPGLDCLAIEQTCIVTDGTDDAVAAVVTHVGTLLQARAVQRVEIKNLRSESKLHAELGKQSVPCSGVQRTTYPRFSRLLRDPETGESVAYGTAKSHRKRRLRQRALERAFDDTLEFSVVTSPDQTDAFVQEAAQIVSHTYQAALNVGINDNAPTRDYLRKLAAEGSLRGYAFRNSDGAIAYAVGDLMCGTYYLWATSYLPAYAKFSPGIVLLNQVFDALTAEGVTFFDFGHGDAEYKRRLGSEEREEQDLCIYGPHLAPRLAFAAHNGSDMLRKLARATLVRFGLLDKLRQRRRGMLRRAGL